MSVCGGDGVSRMQINSVLMALPTYIFHTLLYRPALLATRRTTATNPKSSGAWAHKSNESPKARAEAAMDESDFGGGFNMEMNEAAIAAAKASRRNNKA